MAKVRVLAGDFLQGSGEYCNGVLSIETPLYPWPGLNIKISEIRSIEVVGEESNTELGSSLWQGITGGLVLGPLGAVAGMMLGGERKEVTFLATLVDGRSFLGQVDEASFQQINKARRLKGTHIS